MNIILYSHTFLPAVGGREVVMYQLGRALIARGHKVRVIGPQGFFGNRGGVNAIPIVRYPRLSFGRALNDKFEQGLLELQMSSQLALDITLRGADVIHSHVLYPAGYVASLVRKLMPGKPLVLTPHGVDINVAEDRGYGMRLDGTLRRKIDVALTQCDAVTAISEGIFEALCQTPVEHSKIHRIGNGIDLARFAGVSTLDVRKKLNIPENAKIILTVGNYTPLKGHEDLIQAMPLVVKQIPSATLVIVGANTEHLRGLAENLSVAESVVITGKIPMPAPQSDANQPPDLLAEIYKTSTVYISASNREGAEGLSLSLLDAMAASLPVVGTNIVGNRDIIENGVNGYLVPPGCISSLSSAIVEVFTNEPQTTSMARESLKIAEGRSWNKVAQQYEEIYERVLSK